MNKEDYFKYYIQNSNHYLIPKDIFDELFNEMDNWKQEVKKYKEVIDEANEWVKNKINSCTIEANSTTTDTMCRITISRLKRLLKILDEVE